MPLYPIAITQPVSPANSNTSRKTPVTMVADTTKQLIAANPDRKVLVITNPTNFSLYVDFSQDVSATSFVNLIPKLSTQVIDFPWTGALWGILKGGGGTVEIRELVNIETAATPPV